MSRNLNAMSDLKSSIPQQFHTKLGHSVELKIDCVNPLPIHALTPQESCTRP